MAKSKDAVITAPVMEMKQENIPAPDQISDQNGANEGEKIVGPSQIPDLLSGLNEHDHRIEITDQDGLNSDSLGAYLSELDQPERIPMTVDQNAEKRAPEKTRKVIG